MEGAVAASDADENEYEALKAALTVMCEAVIIAVNKAVIELSELESLDKDKTVEEASEKIAKIAGEQARITGCTIMKKARIEQVGEVKESPSTSASGTKKKRKLVKAAEPSVTAMCDAVNKAVIELSKLESLDKDKAAAEEASEIIAKIAVKQAHHVGFSLMKIERLDKIYEVMQSPSTSTSRTQKAKEKLIQKLGREIDFIDNAEISGKWPEKMGSRPSEVEVKRKIERPWKRNKKLGEGGFGAVYSAVDSNNFKFAVKIGSRVKVTEQSVFRNEVKILGKLSHKNIIKLYGCSGDKENLYMYIELMQGSIADLMKNTKQAISEDLTRKHSRDMMSGLIYLHQNGVIHRDIKCANVLLDSDGTAKLADMGLSKVHVQETLMEKGESTAGTLCFMSPEVLAGNQGGKRSDVWGVGCTVYEMMTMQPPFLQEMSPLLAFLLLPRMIAALEHKNLIPKKTNFSSPLKEFLLKIFVKMEDRPYADDIGKDPWLTSN